MVGVPSYVHAFSIFSTDVAEMTTYENEQYSSNTGIVQQGQNVRDTQVSTPEVKIESGPRHCGYGIPLPREFDWPHACCFEVSAIQARLYSPSTQEVGRKSWRYLRASCAKHGRDGN